MKLAAQKAVATAYTKRITLSKTKSTTVHIVRYERRSVRPRILLFDKATRLLDWCQHESVDEAIVGGFFLRESQKLLGDLWINGEQVPSVPFSEPWQAIRGSIHIDKFFEVQIDARQRLPGQPTGDLLQAGPLLVSNGSNLIESREDREGFSAANYQFDSDITIGRYPRAAIGLNKDYIFTVVADGRSRHDAGLTMNELADTMVAIGADSALNLDGGSSSSLVHQSQLLNTPRSSTYTYPRGRKIYSAIIFDTLGY